MDIAALHRQVNAADRGETLEIHAQSLRFQNCIAVTHIVLTSRWGGFNPCLREKDYGQHPQWAQAVKPQADGVNDGLITSAAVLLRRAHAPSTVLRARNDLDLRKPSTARCAGRRIPEAPAIPEDRAMAKSQDTKKDQKKQPLKTAKEKKQAKKEKKGK
ncbi:MAG: hypothetical protein JJE42_17815 [Burkholderiales bacterium]|nr:hypothetical protein [Burkholderiales bacterium]